MKNILVLAAVASAIAANADVLYDNGLYNAASSGGQSYGWNQTATTPFRYSLADNFTLANNSNLTRLTVYGYTTGNSTNVNMVTSMYVQIRADNAGTPGAVLFGDMTTALAFTETDTGQLRGGSSIRPIHRYQVTLPSWALAAGNYWVEWNGDNVDQRPDGLGSANLFSPNKDGAGNQVQTDLLTGAQTAATNLDAPFMIEGTAVPEPATMIAVGLGLAAVARRRRK